MRFLPRKLPKEQATANPFVIRTSTTICYPEGNEKMKRNAEFLASYIKEVAGTQVVSSETAASNCIMLETDTTRLQIRKAMKWTSTPTA